MRQGPYVTSKGTVILAELGNEDNKRVNISGKQLGNSGWIHFVGESRRTYPVVRIPDEERPAVIADLRTQGFKGHIMFYNPETTLDKYAECVRELARLCPRTISLKAHADLANV